MKIYANALDVWGNEDEGFEVNDVLGWVGSVEVDSLEHDHIILRLIEGEVIWPNKYLIDDFGGEGENYMANLVHRETGKPVLQLRLK